MLNMPEAVAVIGCVFSVVYGVVNITRLKYSQKHCPAHDELYAMIKDMQRHSKRLTGVLEDMVRVRQAVIDLAIFVCENATAADGRSIRDRIITDMTGNNS